MATTVLALVVGFFIGLGADVLRERRAAEPSIALISAELIIAVGRMRRIIRRQDWEEIAEDPLSRSAWDTWATTAAPLLTRGDLLQIATAYFSLSSMNGSAYFLRELQPTGSVTDQATPPYRQHFDALVLGEHAAAVGATRKWWRPRRPRQERQLVESLRRDAVERERRADASYPGPIVHASETSDPPSVDRGPA